MSIQKFSELKLPAAQLDNLNDLGYLTMTPIQAAALPAILSGKDIVGQAKTGSGKTAAFGIGLLETIDSSKFSTQSLVLCPTRELADQVSKELRRLARYIPNLKISTLCGGVPAARQIQSISQHPPHIAVGTPGRILDHLKRNTLNVKNIKMFVLDEADRMLDMGFADEMDAIIEFLPKQRQTVLFSATFPDNIKSISHRIQKQPVMVKIEEEASDKPQIDESVVIYEQTSEKDELVAKLLYRSEPESTVIFCNTIAACQELENYLYSQDVDVLSLHGDLEQRERDQVLLRFSNNSCRVLIATDVAARGLDIANLSMVINYDVPFDAEVYVHRIGRTGRAGKTGIAISLVLANKLHRLEEIEAYIQKEIPKFPASSLKSVKSTSLIAPMVTIEINEGKKSKISAGDILGALTAKGEISGKDVGKINLFPMQAYVAVSRKYAKEAVEQIWASPIKGIRCRARIVGE